MSVTWCTDSRMFPVPGLSAPWSKCPVTVWKFMMFFGIWWIGYLYLGLLYNLKLRDYPFESNGTPPHRLCSDYPLSEFWDSSWLSMVRPMSTQLATRMPMCTHGYLHFIHACLECKIHCCRTIESIWCFRAFQRSSVVESKVVKNSSTSLVDKEVDVITAQGVTQIDIGARFEISVFEYILWRHRRY